MAVLCESTVFSLRVKSWKASGFSALTAIASFGAKGTESGAVVH